MIPPQLPAVARRPDAPWGSLPHQSAQAYGLNWVGPLPVRGGWAPATAGAGTVGLTNDVVQRLGDGETLWHGAMDGGVFTATTGHDGRLGMEHDLAGRFVFDPHARRLAVHCTGDAVVCSRVLVDSVMFTVALSAGKVLLHGSAVVGRDGAVVILGGSGTGKSSLAAALRARGCASLTDDILAVTSDGATVVGHPGPPAITLDASTPVDAGDVLADLGAERWVAAPLAVNATPIRVVAVMQPALKTRSIDLGVGTVLAHMLQVPREAARQRFELAADLCRATIGIEVGSKSASPEVLADQLVTDAARRGVQL